MIHRACSFGEPKQKPLESGLFPRCLLLNGISFWRTQHRLLPPHLNQALEKHLFIHQKPDPLPFHHVKNSQWDCPKGSQESSHIPVWNGQQLPEFFIFPGIGCLLRLRFLTTKWNNYPSFLEDGIGQERERETNISKLNKLLYITSSEPLHPDLPRHCTTHLHDPTLTCCLLCQFSKWSAYIWQLQVVENVSLWMGTETSRGGECMGHWWHG